MTERGWEMITSTNNLREILECRFRNERLEMFDGQGQLVLIIIQFMIKMLPEDDEVIVLLRRIEDLASRCSGCNRHSEEYRNFAKIFRSFVAELEVFFKVPNSMRTLINPNEHIAVFIDLFLEIIEEILHLQPNFIRHVKDSIQTLKMELKFLITFLGDTPSHAHLTELHTTNYVLTDIEVVVNDVGSFLYSFFFIGNRISVTFMNRNLLDLLKKLKLVSEKIIAYCADVANMLTSCTASNTNVVSLFLIDSTLEDLKNVMNHGDDRIICVKAQIQEIHRQLMFLRALLADMEMKQYSELEYFFVRIRDIAYEVEYVVSSFSPILYLTIRLRQVTEKIMLVTMELEEMKKKYNAGILKVAEYPRQGMSLQIETPDIGEEVDLKDEVEKIKDQLLGNREQLQIISIFGMPGLGKTTLAKKIYDDPSIVQNFDKRAWCVVSQNYQSRNILIDILTSMDILNKEAMLDMDEDCLGGNLYKSLLTSRRYIIVMDDIWDVDAWNKIKAYIPLSVKGSRILFTTRDKDVASENSLSSITHALKRLTDEECWHLLQRKVFRKNSCPENLIVTGKEIARKCDGLPLAVVVIAAVLANKEKKLKLWEDVAKRVSSHIAKESSMYMNTLELSYNSLPMYLKPCFLYFGTFEEDREIEVRKLISLWIAEGFIEKVEQNSMETLAQGYLKHLINRSLVQVAQRRSDGGVKTCRMHDLLRDMCLRIAEKEKFMKVIQNQLSIYEQYQRLSIHSRSIPCFSRPFGLHIRSMLGHLPDPSAFIVGNMKLLKVLSLSSMDFRFYNSTRDEDLVLLKFLTVSSIPGSIERFENLEFLFVDNRKVVEIPENLFNMAKLRHVYFSGGAQFSKPCRERAAKGEMFQISSLQRVSHVSVYDKNDEKILRYSPNLRRLKCRFAVFFDSSENNYRYPVLNFLDQLECLCISFRRSYVIDDSSPDLTNLPLNLRRLTLSNLNLSWKQMEIIGKLPELEVFKLRDGTIEEKKWDTNEEIIGKLSELEVSKDGTVEEKMWDTNEEIIGKLSELEVSKDGTVEEKMWDTIIGKLSELEVSKDGTIEEKKWDTNEEIIGKLSELEVSKDGTIKEKKWDTNEGVFKKLKFLELDEVQIKHQNVLNNHFCKLEVLVLRSCKLLKIPSDLENCLTLRKIEVHGCKKSVHRCARRIRKVQKEYNNDVEVNIFP